MELEIRNSEGYHMVSFRNKFAERLLKFLQTVVELNKTTMIFKGEKYIVYECIKRCGYTFGDVCIVLNEKDYIKIIK